MWQRRELWRSGSLGQDNVMKKKYRVITVNGNKYVWRYGIGAGVSVVTISPFEDKTSKIIVEFRDTEHKYKYDIIFPLFLELERNGERRGLKIIEPGMAALLAMYLSQRNIFETRKQITLNGYELLKDMGYNIIRIENGLEF